MLIWFIVILLCCSYLIIRMETTGFVRILRVTIIPFPKQLAYLSVFPCCSRVNTYFVLSSLVLWLWENILTHFCIFLWCLPFLHMRVESLHDIFVWINPSAADKFAPIIPVRGAVISAVGKKSVENVSVKNRLASFLLNYFHFFS